MKVGRTITGLRYYVCVYEYNIIISLFKRFDTQCGYHRCHRSCVLVK